MPRCLSYYNLCVGGAKMSVSLSRNRYRAPQVPRLTIANRSGLKVPGSLLSFALPELNPARDEEFFFRWDEGATSCGRVIGSAVVRTF